MKKVMTLLLVALMFIALTGCSTGESQEPNGDGTTNGENAPGENAGSDQVVEYVDGTYEGEAHGYKDLIKVSVEVTDGKITKVEILEQGETESIAGPALEQTPAAIVEKNSTDVDATSGATITSDGIMDAVKNALEGANK